MKKTFLLKTMLLLCALIAGSTSTWATEKSYTLTFKTSGTSNDGSTSWSTSSKVSDVLAAGGDYVASISAASNIYPARDGRGAKFGTASKTGSITFALSNDGKVKATKVVIKGGAYISKNKAEASAVKVNNGTAVAFNQEVTTYTEEDITYNFPTPTDIESLTLTQNEANKGRLYIVSVTVYYEEDASEGETATWTVEPASATVMAGQSTDLQLTTNYDGTLIFVSDAPLIATVSYNASTKVITITGGPNLGTTTISVTGAATATYKAINKAIAVTVKHAELESNAIDKFGPLGYSYFGMTPEGENTYTQADAAGRSDYHGVEFLFNRGGESNTKPRFDADYMRFYNGNTLTIKAPAGATLRKIVFKEPSKDPSWSGSMSTNGTAYGEYVSEEKTWYATSEDITTLKLTNDATKRIGSIEVYLQVPSVSVTIGTSGYATLASFDLDPLKATPVGELETYVVTAVSPSSVTLEAIPHIPAETGVILKGTPGTTYTIPVFQHGYTVSTNLLKVSDGTITGGDGIYALAEKSGTVGFYKVGAEVYIPRGKCYLNTNTSAPDYLSFDFGATGISEELRVKSEEFATAPIYNLAGQRVAQPTKGLYIVNGKKVVLK